jgi:hypothetical protein
MSSMSASSPATSPSSGNSPSTVRVNRIASKRATRNDDVDRREHQADEEQHSAEQKQHQHRRREPRPGGHTCTGDRQHGQDENGHRGVDGDHRVVDQVVAAEQLGRLVVDLDQALPVAATAIGHDSGRSGSRPCCAIGWNLRSPCATTQQDAARDSIRRVLEDHLATVVSSDVATRIVQQVRAASNGASEAAQARTASRAPGSGVARIESAAREVSTTLPIKREWLERWTRRQLLPLPMGDALAVLASSERFVPKLAAHAHSHSRIRCGIIRLRRGRACSRDRDSSRSTTCRSHSSTCACIRGIGTECRPRISNTDGRSA